jgi:hypothetical protein
MVAMIFGLDYAWGRPNVDNMKRHGVKFVCRYLSHDTTGKNLDRKEAEKLSAAGIWIVVVWETTANRMLSGYEGGQTDARYAAQKARELGMPGDRPIYFAADWDVSEAQQGAVNRYLDGAASVIGKKRVGLYGGYWPVKRALDDSKTSWAWQTYAWSGGRIDKRAHIHQYDNGNRMDGVSVDYNHGLKTDYGQWRIGKTPEKDMEPGTNVKIGAYWAGKGVFSHGEYDAGYLWQAAVGEPRLLRRDIQRLAETVKTQAEVIEVLAGAVKDASPDFQRIREAFADAVDSLVVSIRAEYQEDVEEPNSSQT